MQTPGESAPFQGRSVERPGASSGWGRASEQSAGRGQLECRVSSSWCTSDRVWGVGAWRSKQSAAPQRPAVPGLREKPSLGRAIHTIILLAVKLGTRHTSMSLRSVRVSVTAIAHAWQGELLLTHAHPLSPSARPVSEVSCSVLWSCAAGQPTVASPARYYRSRCATRLPAPQLVDHATQYAAAGRGAALRTSRAPPRPRTRVYCVPVHLL